MCRHPCLVAPCWCAVAVALSVLKALISTDPRNPHLMIAAVSAVAANWYAKHREGTSISQPSFWHAIVAVRTQHQIVNQLCCWHKIITIHRGCTERHSGTIFCSAHATLLVQKHHNQGKERHCQHFDPHFCYFGYFCGCFTLYAAEISNPAPTREPACFLSATYMTMIDKLLESILRLFFAPVFDLGGRRFQAEKNVPPKGCFESLHCMSE